MDSELQKLSPETRREFEKADWLLARLDRVRNISCAILESVQQVDEPQKVEGYAEVLSEAASKGKPIIVRRGGDDFAAVVPLEYLELLRELVARQEAERLASLIDWARLAKTNPPPQAWFDGDEPKPF